MATDIQWANFWINLVLAFITFLAVIIALFKDWIWTKINKPKIVFKVDNKSPYLIQGLTTNKSLIGYNRLGIKNIGKTVAKNCYVKINSVLSETGEKIDYFEPAKLKWSNSPRDFRYREDNLFGVNGNIPNLIPIFKENKDILPNGGIEFCDLFESLGDSSFSFIVNGLRPSFRIRDRNYLVEAEIFGENIEPKKIKFKLTQTNNFPLVKIVRI